MALDDIFSALEQQADKEIVEILQDAHNQAEMIADDANDQADQIRAARIERAEKVTRARASQSLNAARLEAKKRIAAVKEEAVDSVFAAAAVPLAGLRGTEQYSVVFQALVEEAVAGFDGSIEVLVDQADEELAKSTLSKLGIQAPLKPELSTAGGLTVTTRKGRIARRNTFEDRLEKVRQRAQADVAGVLFS